MSTVSRRPVAARLCLALATLSCTVALAHESPRPPRRLAAHPVDLQGVWIMSNMTPLTRLQGFDTLVISAAEAAKIEAQVRARFEDPAVPNEPTEFFDERHIEPVAGTLRSSIIVDPPDGKLPTSAAYDARIALARRDALTGADGPEQRPMPERCITSTAGQPPILSVPSNNLHQIVQTDDAILFFAEALHDARVVRMNATHRPAAVTTLLGDSIGWWEDRTLVIETRHFSPSDQGRVVPYAAFYISPEGTVTERLTRVSDTEIHYEFTVDDPQYYTRPWRGESRFVRSDDPLLEYACHEGNYSLTHILQGARVKDAEAGFHATTAKD